MSYCYLGALGMTTTIAVATSIALLYNKLTTGNFTTPPREAPLGTTMNTKLLEKRKLGLLTVDPMDTSMEKIKDDR